jgi:hypothetical protein
VVSSGNLTPFGKGRRSIDFEVLAAAKMTFLVKIVADRSVDRNEFLERFGAPEFCHRALSLPERLVENLGRLFRQRQVSWRSAFPMTLIAAG